MKRFLITLCALVPMWSWAHCQVPCGIYDDHVQVKILLEHAATIDKAALTMAELAGKTDAQSMNQMVRWVNNKESHAQKIIESISDYFLTQRINPTQKDYAERLANHHAVILAAMKAKQNASGKFATDLIAAIQKIAPYYPPHEELHKH